VKELLFIFLVSLFFAGLTVSVNQALSGRILLNEQTRHTTKLLEVFKIPYAKNASPESLRQLEAKRIDEGRLDGTRVYRGLDEKGEPLGYAIPISGKGFWGRIDGFLSLDNDLKAIKGIIFTNHNETPGLGARIEEHWFRKQFEGLQLANAVRPGKYVEISKSDDSGKNKLDAITGATMTSIALEKIVNDDLKSIVANQDKFRRIEWESPQRR
jgi:Na+-transporting NADH:ubiquinone oxidoreductase subunit C